MVFCLKPPEMPFEQLWLANTIHVFHFIPYAISLPI